MNISLPMILILVLSCKLCSHLKLILHFNNVMKIMKQHNNPPHLSLLSSSRSSYSSLVECMKLLSLAVNFQIDIFVLNQDFTSQVKIKAKNKVVFISFSIFSIIKTNANRQLHNEITTKPSILIFLPLKISSNAHAFAQLPLIVSCFI